MGGDGGVDALVEGAFEDADIELAAYADDSGLGEAGAQGLVGDEGCDGVG